MFACLSWDLHGSVLLIFRFFIRQAVAAAAIWFVVPVLTASADFYPSGLTQQQIAQFEDYESKVVAFLKEQGKAIDLRQFPVVFPQEHGAALIAEVFGDEWSAIRSYADSALAELPLTDLEGLLAAEPVYRLAIGQLQEQFSTLPERQSRFLEARLAAARFWEPQVVAKTAASMAGAQMGTPEEIARNALYDGFVKSRLARTTLNGVQALVYSSGIWMFVIAYERSPRGLIVMTEISAYPRP